MVDALNILVIEDDITASRILELELKAGGYNPICFKNAEDALGYFRGHPIALILVDYGLPGMNGEDFYREILTLNSITPVIFMTALNSVKKAVQLMQMGAYSYLTKPLNIEELHYNIKNALGITQANLPGKSSIKQEGPLSFKNMVFNSSEMQKLLRLVTRVAASNSNILITGESGTGKEVIAQIIHENSRRKEQKLVKVNLAALPPTLIEVELFGALKGAYTGAYTNRPGKFEEADKGTLFLDEIAELSPDIQVKLLRVIQDHEITRLGSNRSINIDIRLIAATNKNIQEAVKNKTFREDLFYRLNVINIHMPPLRNRKDEIPYFVAHFIKKFNRREGKKVRALSDEALNALIFYEFPGNIRELENIIERALVLAENDILQTEDLPLYILSREKFIADGLTAGIEDSGLPLAERLMSVEKEILEKTLKKHKYHQSNAARELGISEGCLRYKMRALNIQKEK
ncbi:MAG: sigma-54 dependent transcriptional regulator [Acidobacteria bacterium]|jgi:two-component system NtrC family response regulator|nr:sigma-54 dependent transcriptional regulator [Acidobacteriota bacterium]